MEDALTTHLAELEEMIHRAKEDGEIDSSERADLAALVERVRDDLTAAESDHESVNERLTDAAVKFESEHPTMATALRSVSNALSALGL